MSDPLTQLLASSSPELLAASEQSRPLRGSPGRRAVCFHFQKGSQLEAFGRLAGIPETVMAEMRLLHATFDLAPIFRVKLSYEGPRRVAICRDYRVAPELPSPVSTLRLLARHLGVKDVSRLEPALAPLMDGHGAEWGISCRNAEVRISCQLPVEHLGALLSALVREGFVTERVAAAHKEAAQGATGRAHVSFNPETVDACSVGYEATPAVLERLPGKLPLARVERVKLRVDPQTLHAWWTVYGPLEAEA